MFFLVFMVYGHLRFKEGLFRFKEGLFRFKEGDIIGILRKGWEGQAD